MLEFRPLELTDQSAMEKYLQAMNLKSCDSDFSNIFIWRYYYNYYVHSCDRFTIIRAGHPGEYNFLKPFGLDDPTECYEQLIAYCALQNQPLTFDLVEHPFLDYVPAKFHDHLEITDIRHAYDYIYSREHLAELKGGSFSRKRNHIKQFTSAYDYTFSQLTTQDLPDVIALTEQWLAELGIDTDTYYKGEGLALQEFCQHFNAIHGLGACLRVKGKMIAFTAGTPHHPGSDTFITHFEKALRQYEGAYAAINKFFAQELLGEFTWINREDDMGLASLRKAKESYFPDELLAKCLIQFK